jgi:uroporphyrin-III C-methyltransferase
MRESNPPPGGAEPPAANDDARADASRRGRVLLVGAGPGDPDLLTIAAVKAIRRATVLLVDDLVGDGVLRYARRSARRIHVGKRGGCASTPQEFIVALMIREAQAGEVVVRLKGGDPLVFGRAGEELAALAAAGVPVEVVNGMTAALPAAAALSASLTHRACAHGVVLASAHLHDGTLDLPWRALVDARMTLVFYMGVKHACGVQQALLDAGMDAATPLAVVERASCADERLLAATLGTFDELLQREAPRSPALLLVGPALAAAGSRYQDIVAQARAAAAAAAEPALRPARGRSG